MVVTLIPRFPSGAFIPFRTRPWQGRGAKSNTARTRIVSNDDSKRTKPRQLGAADFARLSSSMQLTLLIIRRAQLSSRKTIAMTADQKKQQGDFQT